jgi:MFS superfamily sulfate permease-like transporter
VKRLAEYGRIPVLIYFATMVTIVCTDLLTGVITGIVLSLAKLIYHITHIDVNIRRQGDRVDVQFVGAATFLMIPKMASALEGLPQGSEVHLDVRRLAHIDHSCLDLFKSWREQHEKQGGRVVLEMDAMQSRNVPIGQSPVLAEQQSVATRF